METPAVESGQGAVEREPLIDPTPVEKPAPGADDQKTDIPASTDETDKPDAAPDETPEQAEAKKQSRRQRQLTREKVARAAAETEARMLREQLAAERAKSGTQQPTEPVEPKREDFPDYETYLRAVTKFDAEQVTDKRLKAEKAEREASQRTTQQAEQQRGSDQQHKEWTEKETAFKATAPDYEEVANGYLDSQEFKSLSEAARKVLREAGPSMLYHLGANDDLAEAIADLSPLDQKAELAKLGKTLSAAPAKKVSSAPPPLKPINGGRSANSAITGNESQADFEAKLMATGAAAKWLR